MIKLLMIDDDTEVLDINRKYFAEKNMIVETCDDSQKACEQIKTFCPECILLDVMMPGIDGFSLCQRIRKITDAPVLFLSGKVSEDDKIKGFEVGGDDYIEKPYNLREIYARIVAHVKRSNRIHSEKVTNNIIDLDPFFIDKEKHKLFFDNEEIFISNKEYDLLLFLAQNIGKEVTFEEIGNRLWGCYSPTDRRSVMVNVSRLRKKIEERSGIDNLIETVWSKGYKIVKRPG